MVNRHPASPFGVRSAGSPSPPLAIRLAGPALEALGALSMLAAGLTGPFEVRLANARLVVDQRRIVAAESAPGVAPAASGRLVCAWVSKTIVEALIGDQPLDIALVAITSLPSADGTLDIALDGLLVEAAAAADEQRRDRRASATPEGRSPAAGDR